MKKLITLAMLGLFAIVFSMGFNVFVHELGHYAAATGFGYEAQMNFNTPLTNESKTFEIDAALASVSYKSYTPEITKQDAFIAFAGPFVNLILGLALTAVYLRLPKKEDATALLVLICAITSYVAGFSNLFPQGASDGAIIFEYLRNI